jgi:UDP-2-acetamido-2-deoxy-ribo-hexuluronate aminotransferase
MIQMYDPKREYQCNKVEIDEAIQNVLTHGLFINGPEVKLLEPKLAEFVGSKHAITCSNGTDALKVALLALGVSPGDEVITVAHTWFSPASL